MAGKQGGVVRVSKGGRHPSSNRLLVPTSENIITDFIHWHIQISHQLKCGNLIWKQKCKYWSWRTWEMYGNWL